MYLRVLKEGEKKGLINLVFHLFNLDNDFDDHEKNYIQLFTHTTLLDLIDFTPQKYSLQQLILQFKDSSVIVKKTVFYELIYLAYSDHKPSDKEIKFLEVLKNEWGIDDSFVKDARKTANDMFKMKQKVNKIIQNS